jgi:hypothetical protein
MTGRKLTIDLNSGTKLETLRARERLFYKLR